MKTTRSHAYIDARVNPGFYDERGSNATPAQVNWALRSKKFRLEVEYFFYGDAVHDDIRELVGGRRDLTKKEFKELWSGYRKHMAEQWAEAEAHEHYLEMYR